jgi:carotenoid cleavage dioxygenase-like enzyme
LLWSSRLHPTPLPRVWKPPRRVMSENKRAGSATSPSPYLTRRQFAQMVGGFGLVALAELQTAAQVLAGHNERLGRLAHRGPSAEGAWALNQIEGKVPRDLNGTLYRTAPGQKQNHGVTLRHLFDGDAFVSSFVFREGTVHLRARFVDTPERVEEQESGACSTGNLAPTRLHRRVAGGARQTAKTSRA